MLVDPASAPVPSPRAAAPLGATPPLSRIRPGSVADAKKCRATLQALLADTARRSVYLEALVEAAQAKAIHLLLTGPDGAYFASWELFVTTAPPWGLGVPLGALDAVIEERNDPKLLARRPPARTPGTASPASVRNYWSRPAGRVSCGGGRWRRYDRQAGPRAECL